MHKTYTQQAFPLLLPHQTMVEEMLWTIIPNTLPPTIVALHMPTLPA
jgi:hypothetical protein